MISTPKVFNGAVAGINTNGVIPLTLADGGKMITRENATEEFCVFDEMSQGTDAIVCSVVVVGGRDIEDAVHLPAVDEVVPFTLRQRQAEQPAVINADAEQQQPPKHTLVAQSKGEVQVSPGE
jgi:hypothetical protein